MVITFPCVVVESFPEVKKGANVTRKFLVHHAGSKDGETGMKLTDDQLIPVIASGWCVNKMAALGSGELIDLSVRLVTKVAKNEYYNIILYVLNLKTFQ